ncbi:response regulator [Pseudomonas kuykendallii]|uniref:histidine kinase n=1 Tax=Pseudomonas kuykendallii TaxID=1007099 RepID=A0A1H2VI93_9PSED|nr:response regulator [Pseudomonas kuykendallii]MCQ4271185.1 response regulator [Pseudomonas kuykendallii]SDW68041.1 Signal transduction histidine kinase [Pseudomonas kuykendallii]
MNRTSPIDEKAFRRILGRNVSLPLGMGILSSLFFIAIIFYLLDVSRWVEHTDRVIAESNETLKLVIDMETGLRGYLITGDEIFLEPYQRARNEFVSKSTPLKELVADNPVQVNRIVKIEQLQQQWMDFSARMISLRRQGDDSYIQQLKDLSGKRLTDSIRVYFSDVLATESQLRQERTETAQKVTIFGVGGVILLNLLISGFLAFMGRRELMQLSRTYDEVLATQAAHAEKLQQQAWFRSGQTLLAEELIGQLSMNQLGDSTLGFLARYLGMVVGALYVVDDKRLKRVSAYAFSEDQARQRKELAFGEGLVGQVAVDRQPMALESLPENYLRVNSSLGDSVARSVLIFPVEDGGELKGVIELGFLRPLEEKDSELLTLLAGNVGSALAAVNYRQRLQRALADTQSLNEELQVQQEELRSANEELEEQSCALRESQASLEAQQAELEQTNEQLSDQAQALEQHRDQLNERNRDLHQAQLLLETRAEELQRASRYKSEFLANMSHELRTPLNSSLILAKLLADNAQGNLSEEQVKFASSIYSAGNDLLTLINDILDLSKVEAGKLDMHLEPTGLARLGENLSNLFQPLAEQKKLDFHVQFEEGVPASVFTDSQRLEQILKNLLSNAFKFTDKGAVTLRIRKQDDEHVALDVIDSGIGIRAEQQGIIFEAFRQADGTTNRRHGGTGLGLSISRELARMLGATVSVVSEEGKGSTFTLLLPIEYQGTPEDSPNAPQPSVPSTPVTERLPLQPLAKPAPPPVPALTFPDDRDDFTREGRSVLIIEDEPQFAKILFDLAHELKYNCLVAHAADAGYDLALQYQPDAILLDMRLPDHSGLTVLERLKENPDTRHIPVHIVSVEDRQEAAMHMGAVGYATKPVSREQMKDVFLRLEAKLEQKVKRILLVEDDDLQRESVTRLIEDDDIEITAVARGTEALDELHRNTFDCMIIDLKLPDIDGNELLARMAEEDIQSFPPVIVYTGRSLTRDEETELLKYSRSIIIKGARSPERLLDEVTLFLHKVEANMPLERQKMLKTVRNRDRAFEGRKILLVDDDVRNIFALSSALEQKGAVVEIARNGLEAVAKVQEDEEIDLVLMDIMMPEMDGYEAMTEIRKDPRFARLPIIAVTAKAMKDDQDRCLRAGANDYLAKPIELDRLFSLIRVWLPKLEVF